MRKRLFAGWQAAGSLLVLLACAGPASAQGINFGEYHALLIANEKYEHWTQLKTPYEDVADLDNILREEYGFKTKVIRDATRSDIIDELEALKIRLTERDNLLIYYAGHGKIRADGGYWIGVDGGTESRSRWLHYRTIEDLLDVEAGMKARHVLLIADSCYSGYALRDEGEELPAKQPDEALTDWLQRMTQQRARMVMTSGGVQPVLDQVGSSRNSIFASQLLAKLKGGDEVIEGNALWGRIKLEVHQRAKRVLSGEAQAPEYGPIRGIGHDGGDFLFRPKNVTIAVAEPETDLSSEFGIKGSDETKTALLTEAITAKQEAERQAHIATVQRLLAEAQDPQQRWHIKWWLILEAYRRSTEHGLRLSGVEQALRNSLSDNEGIWVLDQTGTVRSVAFSPDNRWLVTGSDDGIARLWSLDHPLRNEHPGPSMELPLDEPTRIVHQTGVNATEFTPDSRRLITAVEDGTVWIWELKDLSQPFTELAGHDKGVKVMAISPDSRRLITGGDDGTVRVWELRAKDPSKSVMVLREHDKAVNVVATSADGRWLATASEDQICRLWDLSAEDPSLAPIDLGGDTCLNLAFSPDSRRLVARQGDGSLRLWDLTAPAPLASVFSRVDGNAVWPLLGISPDGRWLAVSEGARIRVWDLMNEGQVQEGIVAADHETHQIWGMAFTPDGRRLVTTSPRGGVRVWDLTVPHPASTSVLLRGQSAPRILAVSPDGHWLVGGDEYGARVWSLSVEKDIVRFALRNCHPLPEQIWDRYLPDEDYRDTCASLRSEQ